MNLRQYQIDISKKGYEILKESGIVYLSMQTRTGKTITAMEIARLMDAKNVLFVTKKKAIGSILSDYDNFKTFYDITVINYESVAKVALKSNLVYDLAICDEFHAVSAFPRPSKRYKDLKKIVNDIPCILMSATPSPESYSQLFHQFTINKFHSWNKAKNFYKWAKYYVNLKKKYLYNREINDYSDAKIELIKKSTDKYFISFSQEDAGIEQRITEKVLYCEMKPKTYNLIKKLQMSKVLILSDSKEILADTAVKEMSKCHQLFSGTIKTESGESLIIDNSKAIFIKNYFKDQKIVIFYKFIAEFNLLKQIFENYTTSPDEFQINDNIVFLGQFQSAREGIRLDSADAIIFYNIDFSFLSYEQSKNRIVSKERIKPAKLFFIFSKNGIEQKIYKAVINKKNYTKNYYIKDYEGIRNSK